MLLCTTIQSKGTMLPMPRWFLLAIVLGLWVALLSLDAETPAAKPYQPSIAPASNEATLTLPRIRVPAGLKVELFAAEPMLANPVCFSIDEKGRFFVAETFRLHAGVTDIRGHMDWLDDDLAARSVADRVAMLKKHLGPKIDTYA